MCEPSKHDPRPDGELTSPSSPPNRTLEKSGGRLAVLVFVAVLTTALYPLVDRPEQRHVVGDAHDLVDPQTRRSTFNIFVTFNERATTSP